VKKAEFTVKTAVASVYVFNATTHDRAQKWKNEIETRVEESKHTLSRIIASEMYKRSYDYFKDIVTGIVYSQRANNGRGGETKDVTRWCNTCGKGRRKGKTRS